MREIIVLSEILQRVRMAMHDTFGYTFLYIGKPIQALASQHGKGNSVFLAHPLECAGTDFQQIGQLFTCQPDFRLLPGIGLFPEDVIGYALDLVVQVLIYLVIECYNFHICNILFLCGKYAGLWHGGFHCRYRHGNVLFPNDPYRDKKTAGDFNFLPPLPRSVDDTVCSDL
jgi:hypothetical protein